MKRVLITGANRGLGLEFARQLSARGDKVFATCRRPAEADALAQLAQSHPELVSVAPLDVDDADSLRAAHAAVSQQTTALDWLVNNAGINYDSAGMGHADASMRLGKLESGPLLQLMRTNAVGPALVAQQFHDLLAEGESPRIANISSNQGSLTNKRSGGYYGYAASKAALNMLTRCLASDLSRDGVVTVAVNPGWVRTDMGGSGASLDVETSVAGVIAVVDSLTSADNGRFLRWDGAEMPW